MDDKDVSVLYFNGRALDHFGRDHGPIVHVFGDIDNGAGADQKIQRIGRHVAHAVRTVHRAVDMRADMKRGIDPLCDDIFVCRFCA